METCLPNWYGYVQAHIFSASWRGMQLEEPILREDSSDAPDMITFFPESFCPPLFAIAHPG